MEQEKIMRRKEQHRESTVVTILISHLPEPYRGRIQRKSREIQSELESGKKGRKGKGKVILFFTILIYYK